jgi:hypothetical protein
MTDLSRKNKITITLNPKGVSIIQFKIQSEKRLYYTVVLNSVYSLCAIIIAKKWQSIEEILAFPRNVIRFKFLTTKQLPGCITSNIGVPLSMFIIEFLGAKNCRDTGFCPTVPEDGSCCS